MKCSPELIAQLQLWEVSPPHVSVNGSEDDPLANLLWEYSADIIADLVLLSQIQAKLRGVGEAAVR